MLDFGRMKKCEQNVSILFPPNSHPNNGYDSSQAVGNSVDLIVGDDLAAKGIGHQLGGSEKPDS